MRWWCDREARWLLESPEQFESIRAEVRTHLDLHTTPCMHNVLPSLTVDVGNDERCWRFLPLKTLGKFHEQHRKHFPRLMRAIDHPVIENAILSSLDPDTFIPEHRGYFKGYLRYHLPLEVPTDNPTNPTHIVCGGIRHNWVLGRGVLFDDMFLHSVQNTSPNQRRTVLFLDVQRRHLPAPIRQINQLMYPIVNHHPFVQMLLADQHRPQKNASQD